MHQTTSLQNLRSSSQKLQKPLAFQRRWQNGLPEMSVG